jgi:hypothetical protein
VRNSAPFLDLYREEMKFKGESRYIPSQGMKYVICFWANMWKVMLLWLESLFFLPLADSLNEL